MVKIIERNKRREFAILIFGKGRPFLTFLIKFSFLDLSSEFAEFFRLE
jgi:hypothetical protein